MTQPSAIVCDAQGIGALIDPQGKDETPAFGRRALQARPSLHGPVWSFWMAGTSNLFCHSLFDGGLDPKGGSHCPAVASSLRLLLPGLGRRSRPSCRQRSQAAGTRAGGGETNGVA